MTTIPTTTQTITGLIRNKPDHSYITSLPTFADRGQAIGKRLEAVKADPKYQALPEDKKARVRADLYDKYVPASYSGFHLPVPDKNTWVGATGRDTAVRDYEPGSPKFQKFSESYKTDNFDKLDKDLQAGITKAWSGIEMFGAKVANKTFSSIFHLDEHYSHQTDEMLQQKVPEYMIAKNIQRQMENFIDARKAEIQSDDFWLQTHPRDTVIGRLGSSAGEIVATLPLYEALGAYGVGAKAVGVATKVSLAAKLAASPVGQFVTKRLISATDVYLASLAESGGSNKEALASAAGGIAVESGGALIGKGIKIAAAPLIKKWTANTIAMGGIPFAEDIAQSAAHEVEQEVHHAEKGEGEQIARIKAFYEDRKKYDSVIAKLHEGEKVSQNSVAIQMYGKNLNQLSKDQRSNAFMKRIELIHQAAQEAPVHLPDLYKEEVEHNIVQARQANPIFNQLLSSLEKQGVKPTEAATENGISQIAKDTGISNTKGASKKLNKATKPIKSVGADLATTKKNYSYATYRGDSIAEFRAPRNRVTVSHLVSDRSKLTLNKFIDNLKSITPKGISFEDPAHMMLYHYGNADKLPEGVKNALQYRFKQIEGYENSTPASLRREAGMIHAHIRELGYTGHLQDEGNVFRSTNTKGPYSWTVWQRELSDEVIDQAIEPAQKALKNHPTALKSFNASINALKKTRPNLKTAEEVITFENNIGAASQKIAAHVAGKDVPLQ